MLLSLLAQLINIHDGWSLWRKSRKGYFIIVHSDQPQWKAIIASIIVLQQCTSVTIISIDQPNALKNHVSFSMVLL